MLRLLDELVFDWQANQLRLCCLCVLAEHKMIIVGLDNAGKTTILYQL